MGTKCVRVQFSGRCIFFFFVTTKLDRGISTRCMDLYSRRDKRMSFHPVRLANTTGPCGNDRFHIDTHLTLQLREK